MYNKSPRGRLVDPAFTPLGGIASRLLQRSLQAGLRLPGGPKPTPTFFTGVSLVWTHQTAPLLGPPAAWLPGFVETLPATSQKQKRVVSPLGSHVCPKRKKQAAPARRAEARPTPAKRRSYRVLQKRCLQRLKNKSALFPRLAVMFARSAKSRPCLLGGLKPPYARQAAYSPGASSGVFAGAPKGNAPGRGRLLLPNLLRRRRFLRWSLLRGRRAVRCFRFPGILCRCGSRRRSGRSRPARGCRAPR